MKTFSTLIAASIVAVWTVAIALVSVQNASPVSFRFLTIQTIEFPFGLVLAFASAMGMIGAAIALPLLGFSFQSGDE